MVRSVECKAGLGEVGTPDYPERVPEAGAETEIA
jgi:hypothetical protein